MQSDGAAQVRLFGVIGGGFFEEGIGAEQFSKDLDALEGSPALNVQISSPGGSVREGVAIHNTLRAYAGPVSVEIVSDAASIASVIAMAADEGALSIADSGRMMIHNAHGGAMGDGNYLRKYADMLDMVNGQMADIYAARTGNDREEVLDLMDDETWMTGAEAVELGFADTLIDYDTPGIGAAAVNFNAAMYGDQSKYFACVARYLNSSESFPAVAQHEELETVEDDKIDTPQENTPKSNVIAFSTEQTQALAGMIGEAVNTSMTTIMEQAKADAAREQEVRMVFTPYGAQYDEVMNSVLASKGTAKDAKAALFDKQGEGIEPLNVQRVSVGVEHRQKAQAGMINSLASRLGYEERDPENEFNGFTMLEMARICAQADHNLSRGSSRLDVVASALTHGTSNFPQVLENVANKSMLTGWDEEPTSYQFWCRMGNLNDFKQAKRVGLHTFGNLPVVEEGAEYTYAVRPETGEPIILATYGNVFPITRQAIINDDLSAFTDTPNAQGAASRRTVNATAIGALTANGGNGVNMSDGVPIFDATHNNVGTAAALDVDPVDELRHLLRTQTDLTGTTLNIMPANLLVPAKLETIARTTIMNANDPRASAQTNVINPVNGIANVVGDGVLDATSETRYYMMAATNRDVMEVAFLDGVQAPRLERDMPFMVDAIRFKVSIDFGVAPRDFRGMAKNDGA